VVGAGRTTVADDTGACATTVGTDMAMCDDDGAAVGPNVLAGVAIVGSGRDVAAVVGNGTAVRTSVAASNAVGVLLPRPALSTVATRRGDAVGLRAASVASLADMPQAARSSMPKTKGTSRNLDVIKELLPIEHQTHVSMRVR